MSHFTVMVIGENPEDQLKPFQENNMGNCPGEYLTFTDQEDEYLEGSSKEFYDNSSSSWGMKISQENFDSIKNGITVINFDNGSMLNGYFRKGLRYKCGVSVDSKCPTEYIWIKVVNIIKTDHPSKDVCFRGIIEVSVIEEPKELLNKELYATFEIFCKEYHGYEKRDVQMNRYGYWSNTDKYDENGALTSGSRWDWYQKGGRWFGFFKLKPESYKKGRLGEPSLLMEVKKSKVGFADQAKKSDIDFEAMREEKRNQASLQYACLKNTLVKLRIIVHGNLTYQM